MADDRSVDGDLLHVAASLVVVAAFHHRTAALAGEAHRAVGRVVDYCPNARRGFDEGLVARGVVRRHKRRLRFFFDACVLVEVVGRVGKFLGQFPRRLAVADVVVAVTVGGCSQSSPGEFVSAVVAEAVSTSCFGSPLLGAGDRASQCVVALAAGDQRGSPQTAAYGHCQVTVFFIGKFPDDAVGHREAGGQAASRQVAVGEGLFFSSVHDSGAGKPPVGFIALACFLEDVGSLFQGIAGGPAVGIVVFLELAGGASYGDAIGVRFVVGSVSDGARA